MDTPMRSDRPTTFAPSGIVSMETGDEVYREYEFGHSEYERTVYRIDRPVSVEYMLSGTTHRVFDHNNVMHIVPAPGFVGCVVRVLHQPDVV